MRLVASARTAGLCCLVLGLALGLVGTVATPARDSTRLSAVALGDGYYVITGNVEKSTNKDTQPRFRGWTSADGKKWGRVPREALPDRWRAPEQRQQLGWHLLSGRARRRPR